MKEIKEASALDVALGMGNPVLTAISSVVREKQKKDSNKEYRDEQRAKRDAEYQAKYGKTGQTSIAPTIEAPKEKRDAGRYVIPSSIHTDEDPKSPKVDIPKDIVKASKDYSQKTSSSDDQLSFGQAFAKNRKAGAKEFTWKGKSFTTKIKEDANIVSGGDIAGLGVGHDGEPGIPKKRKPRIVDLVTFMKRK
jgi:hypothetical protein